MMKAGACSARLDGVHAGYRDKTVLRGVNLEVEPGSLVAVMGPNGAGKTTLLRVLAGLLKPAKGVVEACGAPPWSEEAKKRITYIPSHPDVDPYLTGIDVALMHRYGLSDALITWPKSDLEAAKRGLKELGAERLARARWGSMSGGERRLTVLAGALARGSGLILLDEPFSNLDLANQAQVAFRLRSMAGSATVIFTAHEPLHASIADKIVVVSGGRVEAQGPPEEVLRREVLERVYGVRIAVVRVEGLIAAFPLLAV